MKTIKIKNDRELDAAVAEHIVGWEKRDPKGLKEHGWKYVWFFENEFRGWKHPYYSSNIHEAMKVAFVAGITGLMFEAGAGHSRIFYNDLSYDYIDEVHACGPGKDNDCIDFQIKQLARNICKVALKIKKGIEIDYI